MLRMTGLQLASTNVGFCCHSIILIKIFLVCMVLNTHIVIEAKFGTQSKSFYDDLESTGKVQQQFGPGKLGL